MVSLAVGALHFTLVSRFTLVCCVGVAITPKASCWQCTLCFMMVRCCTSVAYVYFGQRLVFYCWEHLSIDNNVLFVNELLYSLGCLHGDEEDVVFDDSLKYFDLCLLFGNVENLYFD